VRIPEQVEGQVNVKAADRKEGETSILAGGFSITAKRASEERLIEFRDRERGGYSSERKTGAS